MTLRVVIIAGAKAFKIIDLGAAADLRVGINYVPNEFLLDPRSAHLPFALCLIFWSDYSFMAVVTG